MIILHGALCGAVFLPNGSGSAQSRDHLTDQETELVRFYQELDKRIEVFVKAIDRRFAIINGTTQPAARKSVKDEPDWGEAPAMLLTTEALPLPSDAVAEMHVDEHLEHPHKLLE